MKETEFSDKIPAILVKELRQNLRTPWFAASFLLIQMIFLLLTLVSGFAAQSEWFIWRNQVNSLCLLLYSAIFVTAIPFQVSGSLASEVRSHTLELVLITRISPSGLVWGKWFSTMIRTAIFASTITPYIIFQHFLSAYDFVWNLEALGLIFLAGMVLTALAISLSIYRSIFLRALELGTLLVACLAIFLIIRFASMFTGVPPVNILLMIIVDSILFITVLLEAGASRIAPQTENHAFLKRLVALVALGLAFIFSRLDIFAPAAYGAASIIVLLVLLDGLSEDLSFSPLTDRHSHRSILVRLLSFIFSPGWASAAVFSLLIFGISLEVLQWEHVSKDPRMALIFASLFAGILWPAALIRFLLPKTQHFSIFYFLFQLVGSILALLIYSIPSKTNGFWDVLVCFAPMTVFFLATTNTLPSTGLDIYLWVSTILCCLSLLLLIAKGILMFSEGREKKMQA